MILKTIDLILFSILGSGCRMIGGDKLVYYAFEKPIRGLLNGIPLDVNHIFLDWRGDCICVGYSESCVEGVLISLDEYESLFGSVIDGFDLVECTDIKSIMFFDSDTGNGIGLGF